MSRFTVLAINRNKGFYLVQDQQEYYHVLEIDEDLQLGDEIISHSLIDYRCDGIPLSLTIQWEDISLEKGRDIILYGY